MSNNKYYTVWEGKTIGVFDSWDECREAVTGCRAIYKSFATRDEAVEAFNGDYRDYVGKNEAKMFNYSRLDPSHRPLIPSICVDAACSGNPGKLEFRGVETATGAEIFHRGPFEEGTQNIGEFLAIAFGLAILRKAGANLTIYSDSMTAISWIKHKSCNTKLQRSEKNKDLFYIVDKAVEWLKNNDCPNPIVKWDTEAWGEIPADFGRK